MGPSGRAVPQAFCDDLTRVVAGPELPGWENSYDNPMEFIMRLDVENPPVPMAQ